MRDAYLLILAIFAAATFATFVVLIIKYQEAKDDKGFNHQKERTYIFK